MPGVEIYTDGACRGNPGPVGWGALLIAGDQRKEIHGAEAQTTNNRMELTAAIEGLLALKRRCQVKLYTDSKYVMHGITEWLPGWKARGWRTAGRAPVKNQDLWERLDNALGRHKTRWVWTKGHAAHDDNNRCDELARAAAERQPAGQ